MASVDGRRFMTKTQHYRKVTKPLLERKRRARMNLYIDELKDLIADKIEGQGDHVAKWEKADILEMTVNFLKTQRQENVEISCDSAFHLEKFRAGYTQAAYDVSKIFSSVPGLDLKFGTRLMQHLGWRLKDIRGQKIVETPTTSAVSLPQNSYTLESNSLKQNSKFELKLKAEVSPQKQEDVWRPW